MYDYNKQEWVKGITLDDLNEKNKEIAEIIGIDNLLEMCYYFGGGEAIYFNKLDELLKIIRNRKIVEDYRNRHSVNDIAKKYGITVRRVYQILFPDAYENQLNLFNL